MSIHALRRFLVHFYIDHEPECERGLEHGLRRALEPDLDRGLEVDITVFVAVAVDPGLDRRRTVCPRPITVDGVVRDHAQCPIRIHTLIRIPTRDRHVVIHRILIIQRRERGKAPNETLIAKDRGNRVMHQMTD